VAHPLYDDGGLLLDEDGLTIRRYYFSVGGRKAHPLHRDTARDGSADGLADRQGSRVGHSAPGLLVPQDLRRAAKRILVVLDVGHRVKPCVTPDDPDRFVELLQGRVPVG
jgi:hypothetical protein